MTFVESSQQGAAANRRTAESNPLNLLRKLRDDDRTGSMTKVLQKWRQRVIDDSAMLDAALVYAGTNYWNRLEADEKSAAYRQRGARAKAIKQAEIIELAQQVRRVVLMDLVLPNGKRLAEAKFADCRKAGGWLIKVAKKGRPNQVVSDVLTENDLHKIFAS